MGHCESDTVARIPLLACLAISRGTIMTLAITALLVKQPASCLALALVPHEDQGGRLAMNRPGIASSGQPRPQHAGALHCVHLHMVPLERKWVDLMAKKLPFWQVTGGLPREPPPMHGEQRPKRARYAAGIPSTFCTPDDIGALYGPREGVRCEQRCLVLAPREDRFAEGLTQGGWWNSSSAPATSYMLSDHGGMMRISDKLELAKIADPQDARFDQNAARYLPRTYPLDEPKFPCFLKCRVGTFSSGVKMLANRSDYETAMRSIPAKHHHNWLVQEAVQGVWEYSIVMVVVDGVAAYSYSYRQKHGGDLFVWPRSRPLEKHVEREASLQERAGCERFLRGYNGMVDCTYKLRGDDEAANDMAIIEFNTRLTGHFFTMPHREVQKMMGVYVRESIRQGRQTKRLESTTTS